MEASTRKNLVLRGFESNRLALETFIPAFYKSLFSLCPQARDIFPTDTERLDAKLLASLTHMTEALESTERLDVILRGLGKKHRRMQISDSHFEYFIQSFTEALATTLGPEWTEETQEAWTDFLRYIAKRMNYLATEDLADIGC